MKNFYVTIFSLCFSLSALFAQKTERFELVSQSNSEITMKYQKAAFAQKQLQINGQSYLMLKDLNGTPIQEKGAPELPKLSQSVIIPNQGKVSLSYTYDSYTDYPDILIAPSKGTLKRNVNPADVPFTFGDIYQKDEFYPGTLAEVQSPYIFRAVRGTAVTVYPYQYNPVSKTLRVYNNLTVTVNTNQNETGINELTVNRKALDDLRHIYGNRFLNSEKVLNTHRYTPKGEEGKLLIITKDSYASLIQPLVDWKIQKGIPTTVVNISTVGNTQNAIKSYIANAYNADNSILYVLFVGEHSDIKSYNAGTSSEGETKWSDEYYALISGNDHYPELFIGRLSGETNDHITTQVNRILEYEKNPLASEYYRDAIGLASNEGAGQGDDGEADNAHMRNIGNKLKGHTYTNFHEFYQGSQGGNDAAGEPTPSMITSKINSGVSLFHYAGHGDLTTVQTGNYSISDINSLNNNGKYPFFVSVACQNGMYTAATCFAEAWVRAKNASGPTGAVNIVASSILMVWTPPMQVQDEMTEIMIDAYANNKKYTMGGLFYNSEMSMLDNYSSNAGAKEVVETWLMFGDPSTVIRTVNPMSLTVTHTAEELVGISSYTVNCNTNGALVCVTQNGVILGKALVTGGTATINFTGGAITSTQDLKVTATKFNYKPYQGDVDIKENLSVEDITSANGVSIYPNPSKDQVTLALNYKSKVSIDIIDVAGRRVYSSTDVNGQLNQTLDVSNYAAGTYLVQITHDGNQTVKKLIVSK